jgi:hypothetical protein
MAKREIALDQPGGKDFSRPGGALAVGVIRIGSPLAGRTVTLICGHTFGACSRRNSKRWVRQGSAIVASCKANDEPMQMRGPTPNGR